MTASLTYTHSLQNMLTFANEKHKQKHVPSAFISSRPIEHQMQVTSGFLTMPKKEMQCLTLIVLVTTIDALEHF